MFIPQLIVLLLARPDVEGDAVDRSDVAEVLREVDQTDLRGAVGPLGHEAASLGAIRNAARGVPVHETSPRRVPGNRVPAARSGGALVRPERGEAGAHRQYREVRLGGVLELVEVDGDWRSSTWPGGPGGSPGRLIPRLRMTDSCGAVSTPSATIDTFHCAGQLLERPEHRVGRILADAALDERQVDLDDIEVDLAEQPQACVAGADVVGGQPHPGPAAGLDVRPQLVEVLDLLALGQLEHDPVERDLVAAKIALSSPTRNRFDSSVRGERLTLR